MVLQSAGSVHCKLLPCGLLPVVKGSFQLCGERTTFSSLTRDALPVVVSLSKLDRLVETRPIWELVPKMHWLLRRLNSFSFTLFSSRAYGW